MSPCVKSCLTFHHPRASIIYCIMCLSPHETVIQAERKWKIHSRETTLSLTAPCTSFHCSSFFLKHYWWSSVLWLSLLTETRCHWLSLGMLTGGKKTPRAHHGTVINCYLDTSIRNTEKKNERGGKHVIVMIEMRYFAYPSQTCDRWRLRWWGIKR